MPGCEAILRQIFRRRHLAVDKRRKGDKKSHLLGYNFLSVGTHSFPYPRELNFVSDADDCSDLVVIVYQKHRFEKGEPVGRLIDTIGGVLGKSKDGGTNILCIIWSTDTNSAIKVLEDTLHTPDGSDLSGVTIKFTLAAEPRGDVDEDKRQATDAVARATATVIPLSSTPTAVGLLSSAVNAGTNIVTEVQTFETTWGILLQRLELFNKIVDGFAQVCGKQYSDSHTV